MCIEMCIGVNKVLSLASNWLVPAGRVYRSCGSFLCPGVESTANDANVLAKLLLTSITARARQAEAIGNGFQI